MMPEFNVGDRVRPIRHPGFAGKITGRCWMPESIHDWTAPSPDGFVVKVSHVPDDPAEQRYLGWEFAARPDDLEHID